MGCAHQKVSCHKLCESHHQQINRSADPKKSSDGDGSIHSHSIHTSKIDSIPVTSREKLSYLEIMWAINIYTDAGQIRMPTVIDGI